MSFQHGLSGLSVASSNLDTIGNNIANANTSGYKLSTVQFSDVFTNSMGGAGGKNQIGIGTTVAAVSQEFSQGNISKTNNPLDIAINGGGFFRMSNAGEVSYSRSGQFHVDNKGFVVNSQNLNLMGYMPDAAGNIVHSETSNLKISTADINPKVTTTFSAGFNLDSRTVSPAVLPAFDATDPATYASSTSGTVFDSLGGSHLLTLFFQKTPASGEWNAFATVDGATASGVPVGVDLGAGAGLPQTLTFDTNGVLTTPAAPLSASISLDLIATNLGTSNNATTPLIFDLDLTKATQFGGNFGVNSLSQDGSSSGRLAGFSTSNDGIISGNYTNGETRNLGQLALANFSNPQGLTPRGNGLWSESSASGTALIGAPGTGSLGVLQASAVEDSNVDLTTQLVNMITAQRAYQANAKTIETQDAVLQTLVNL